MTGKYEHTMDAKGRVAVPSKLRERLGERFHVAIGASRESDGEVTKYLALYPSDVWQQLEEKINALPSNQAAQADVLLAYGPESNRMLIGALTGGMPKSKGRAFTDKDALVAVLKQMAKPGDVILFKGSRGMRMEQVLEKFLQEDK